MVLLVAVNRHDRDFVGLFTAYVNAAGDRGRQALPTWPLGGRTPSAAALDTEPAETSAITLACAELTALTDAQMARHDRLAANLNEILKSCRAGDRHACRLLSKSGSD
jgi:hypothetical protein